MNVRDDVGAEATPGAPHEDTLDMTVPAQAEHLPGLRAAARGFAEHHGARRPADVALAVTESCTNVILHAYRTLPAGPLHLTGWLDHGLVYLGVADEGCGLGPNPASPGLGLGTTLVARLADDFRIGGRVPTGTEVIVGFARVRVSPTGARWVVSGR
jgi:serine/threonine-protein kinase RsbW